MLCKLCASCLQNAGLIGLVVRGIFRVVGAETGMSILCAPEGEHDAQRPLLLAQDSPESQRLHFKDRLHSSGCRPLVIGSLLGARSQQHKPPAHCPVPGARSQASLCQKVREGRGLPLGSLGWQQSWGARTRSGEPPSVCPHWTPHKRLRAEGLQLPVWVSLCSPKAWLQ